MSRVVIVGGGTAGLAAARTLANRGVKSLIVERSGVLGGRANGFGCKGRDECVRCDVCLSGDQLDEVKASELVERIKGSVVTRVSGQPGDFNVTIKNLTTKGARRVKAGAVIAAIGYQPFAADRDSRLGHGLVPDVITAEEAEWQLNQSGSIVVPSTGKRPKEVAFIQCVGSRDARLGADYCSKVCCKYSLKMGQLLMRLDPEIRLSFLFMDWRPYQSAGEVYDWSKENKGIELLRSRPAEVVQGDSGRPAVRYATPGDSTVEEREFDLVVLSIGISPPDGAAEMGRVLGIGTDEFGFLRTDGSGPCATSREGVFLAGCCSGPKDIEESAKEGVTAAGMALELKEGGR
jgi:heterodisulfide reductase subunit A